ncbi:fimbrial protein [Pseudomonas chlororaphis]|uniref:fimbrial protein n=1 Tax=Pseudomonas chlororaphis TaxID=587753 RepID=UPI0023671D74|nr:fimbrial protein [Pseudomonas chlororaphis]WDH19992.1 fimbrial protein [Pseudomonas chlororaphis]
MTAQQRRNCSPCCLGRRMLVTFFLYGFSGVVWADGTWVDCVRDDSSSGSLVDQYFSSSTVEVGRDAAIGDPIGNWISVNNPLAWSCQHRESQKTAQVNLQVQGYPPYTKWRTINFDGETYGVYASNDPWLGYIARWRFTVNGDTSGWQPLTTTAGGWQTPSGSFRVSYGDGRPYPMGVETQIHFVKKTDELRSGRTNKGFDPIYVRPFQSVGSSTYEGGSSYRISKMRSGDAVFSAGGTCTTPDVNVVLPTTTVNQFIGVGSIVALTPFNLSFNDCPSGLNSIGYHITATTNILDAANGVIALDASSTASGVGIQFLTGDESPLKFDTQYSLADYDPTAKHSYTVPLKAGLYQTEGVVTAGSAKASITYTLNYK